MPLTLLRHAVQKPPVGPLKLDTGHPLAWGLSNCWVINEYRSNQLNDFGQKNQPLLFQDAPTWASGKMGADLSFNGTSNYLSPGAGVNLGSDLFGSTQDSALEVWINETAGADSTWRVIAQQGINGANWWGIWHGGTNFYVLGATSQNLNGSAITTGLHHIIIQRSAAGARIIWVDAVDAGGDAGAVSVSNSNEFTVGRQVANTEQFNGHIIMVRVWRRVFSAVEVAALYAEPYCMFQTRPMQRWMQVGSPIIPPGLGPVVQMQQEFHLDTSLMR